MDQETAKLILPALIGAGSAILVFLIKDIILFELRERRIIRRQLLDRKLSKLYAPLAVALKGGAGTIDNIFSDNDIFPKYMENMHLLSPDLYNLMHRYSQLGDNVRAKSFKHSEGEQRIEITKEFLELFPREFEKLREEYQGGFWRFRLTRRRLTNSLSGRKKHAA